jgi:DNA-binding MarR family transcriptional regulator
LFEPLLKTKRLYEVPDLLGAKTIGRKPQGAKKGRMQRTDDEIPDGPGTGTAKSLKLSERDVEDATRLLSLLSEASTNSASGGRPDRFQMGRHARALIKERRDRAKFFGRAMFGEPAWEMLLVLYASEGSERYTISRLAESGDAARATALRWIEYLLKERLIERSPHPTDKRSFFVKLADKGRQALEGYFSTLIRSNSS